MGQRWDQRIGDVWISADGERLYRLLEVDWLGRLRLEELGLDGDGDYARFWLHHALFEAIG